MAYSLVALPGDGTGPEVMAEGIESHSELRVLRELGCDVGQGFLLAQPMDAAATRTHLEANERGPAMSDVEGAPMAGAEMGPAEVPAPEPAAGSVH